MALMGFNRHNPYGYSGGIPGVSNAMPKTNMATNPYTPSSTVQNNITIPTPKPVTHDSNNNSMFGSQNLSNEYYNANPTSVRSDNNSWSWQGNNRVYTPFKYAAEHPTGNNMFDEAMQRVYAGLPLGLKPPTW